jgi:hypothetical protein
LFLLRGGTVIDATLKDTTTVAMGGDLGAMKGHYVIDELVVVRFEAV